jgi:hypothetical protein
MCLYLIDFDRLTKLLYLDFEKYSKITFEREFLKFILDFSLVACDQRWASFPPEVTVKSLPLPTNLKIVMVTSFSLPAWKNFETVTSFSLPAPQKIWNG